MLEAYQAYGDMELDDGADRVAHRRASPKRSSGTLEFEYQGRRSSLATPWRRRDDGELVSEAAGW